MLYVIDLNSAMHHELVIGVFLMTISLHTYSQNLYSLCHNHNKLVHHMQNSLAVCSQCYSPPPTEKGSRWDTNNCTNF